MSFFAEIFLGTLLVLIPVDPLFAEGGSFLLSPKETIDFVIDGQKEISGLIPAMQIFNYSAQEQAALTLARGSMRKEVVSFFPGFVTTETVRVAIKAALFLQRVSENTVKELINQLEKASVEEANKFLGEWLINNKMKTGSGTVRDKEEVFYYLVVFEQKDSKSADVVIQFFSPNQVPAPQGVGSMGGFSGFVGDSPYVGTVPPFIVTIQARAVKSTWSWTIEDSSKTKISVEFPEEFPDIEFSGDLPYAIEEPRRDILNTIAGIKNILKLIEGPTERVGDDLRNFLLDAARLVQSLPPTAAEAVLSLVRGEQEQTLVANIQEEQQRSPELSEEEVVDNLTEPSLTEPTVIEEAEIQVEVEQEGENLAELSSEEEGVDNLAEPGSEEDEQEDGEGFALCEIPESISLLHRPEGIFFQEVGWMGTEASSADEWIKLKNPSFDPVSLIGWQILDKDGDIAVVFGEGEMPSQGIFTLERTDDDTLPDSSADKIYTGSLRNQDEALYLFDNTCSLQDFALANPDWPGGDNKTKEPMIRLQNFQWGPLAPLVPQLPNIVEFPEEFIPGPGEKQFAGCQDGQINVNKAPAEDLVLITQIGEVRAQSIIGARAEELFYSVDELTRISGIGDGIVGQIKVQGLACAASPDGESDTESTSSSSDTTAPSVSFAGLSSTQSELVFQVGWEASDPSPDASGVKEVLLSYSVNPAASGSFLKYEEGGTFLDWNQGAGSALSSPSLTGTVTVSAGDGITYAFSLKAVDNSENEGSADAETTVGLAKNVVINEIAWAGTVAGTADEWIELYNTTSSSIDLTGWTLKAADETPTIALTGTIPANGYYLLERTDDSAVSDVAADQTYTGALSNTGEELLLSNASGTVVDRADSSGGWFAGDSTSRISMERIVASDFGSSGNWASNNLISVNGKDNGNNNINGTPKAENSVSKAETEVGNSTLRFNEFDELTFGKLGSPYVFTADITIPQDKKLTVDPGVEVKFANKRSLAIDGTLEAIGTATEEITFKKRDNVWCGIHFRIGSTSSVLDHVVIEGGSSHSCSTFVPAYSVFVEDSSVTFKNLRIPTGDRQFYLRLEDSDSVVENVEFVGWADTPQTAVRIEGGSPTITSSSFTDFTDSAIWARNASVTVTSNTFTNVTYPVFLDPALITSSGNTIENATYEGIWVDGVNFGTDIVWDAKDLPYLIIDGTHLQNTQTLTIKEGVSVFLDSAAEFRLDGLVNALGTAGEPITVAGRDNGSWKRLYLLGPSNPDVGESLFQHVNIKNGGAATGTIGALHAEGRSLRLENVTFEESGNAFDTSSALYSKDSTITGSNLTFLNNDAAFWIDGTCPTVTGVSVTPSGSTLHASSDNCVF